MGPQSEHEWTVHSLNIHGIFFERWCQKVVGDTPPWRVIATNYPVEFPPPNGPLRGRESALDIRAVKDRSDFRVNLVIECKKNNPEFVNWVFFGKAPKAEKQPFIVSIVEYSTFGGSGNWSGSTSMKELHTNLLLSDDARETRGNYSSIKANSATKTKTANAAIQEAAYQVALACQALVHEDYAAAKPLGGKSTPTPVPWRMSLYLPVIVTTAKLFVCDFQPSDVSPSTGEVGFDKVGIRPVTEVVFEYPLPRHLQHAPADLAETIASNSLHWFAKKQIVVVQSEHFKSFLAELLVEEPKGDSPGHLEAGTA